ncbi:hypothetical protein C5167_028712 [Papaver somniferum]|uniref:uncharacterized protein LOC113338646 n=1 Tax=Papaver somniferum TaxID=3469 RepID=UPI000E6FBCEF|nr:uncharacterized protein LOC113338646 [Papaver somniferum]RZC90881.1 hypothetical protein C5167_028712 [Papaver somniferum]
MKDQKNNTVVSSSSPSSSTTTTTARTNNPQPISNLVVRAGTIRKNNDRNGLQQILQNNLFLQRRIKEYILFSKLKSMVPPPQAFQEKISGRHEEATELDMELREIPSAERDSDEETKTDDDDEDDLGNTSIDYDSDYEKDGDEVKSFVPSIKISKIEDLILINTTVLKKVALTSFLFRILEEENLDIVFENQYRTESVVAHTIQVRVQPEYNIQVLENRLRMWAGGLL